MVDEINNGASAPQEQRERPERGERPGRPEGRGGPRGRFQRRRVCSFCVDKVENIDYKDVNTLRRYVSDHGAIDSRRRTGTCARHQRRLTAAIKRARHLALLPYTAEHIRRLNS